ncbi:hypothetical protein [Companilactobacillus sp. HBUAS56275]|uniref:Uncharacterized protein n=1 Tax=Candidatus Companilactobacillus pullicola TaxID=2838523 RepID=A0A9D1ZSM5_9LACO|nr:hypothetical protein [Candidatus Companilactobacillus pullicola]
MTRMQTLNSQLFFKRWKMVNLIFLIDLIVLSMIMLVDMIFNKLVFKSAMVDRWYTYYVLIIFISYIVSFILLAKDNERVLFSNKYRMIPIVEWKLYLSNILSSFLAVLYLWFLESLGNTIFRSIQVHKFMVGNTLSNLLYTNDLYRQSDFEIITTMFAVGFFLMVLIWSIITLVHFLISLIAERFDLRKKKVIRTVLYIVITYLCLMIFNSSVSGVFVLMYGDGFNVFAKINRMLLTSIYIFSGWIVVLTAINIYLLTKHVETDC